MHDELCERPGTEFPVFEMVEQYIVTVERVQLVDG